MPAETSDPPPAQTAPSWSGAAIAAGAVLAGLALGRSGRVGLAAGVAAAASVKLMSGSRREDGGGIADLGFHPHTTVPPEAWENDEALLAAEPSRRGEERDWVDSDAIFFDHVVPASEAVHELLKPKALPLLDDDGVPVQEALPVRQPAQEERAAVFPLGPVIWDPSHVVQSCSESTSETVWFGLQEISGPATGETACEGAAPVEDAVPPPPETAPDEPPPEDEGIPAHSSREEDPPSLEAEALSAALHGEYLAQPSHLPSDVMHALHPTAAGACENPPVPQLDAGCLSASVAPPDEVAKGVASSFLLVADEDEACSSTPVPSTDEGGGMSFPAWMTAAPAEPPVQIMPRPPLKSGLPRPRKPGELPRHLAESPGPGTVAPADGDRHALLSRLLVADGAPEATGQHGQSKVLLPAAPTAERGVARKGWLLAIVLALCVVAGITFAASRWHDGELLRKAWEIPWRKWFDSDRAPLPRRAPSQTTHP